MQSENDWLPQSFNAIVALQALLFFSEAQQLHLKLSLPRLMTAPLPPQLLPCCGCLRRQEYLYSLNSASVLLFYQ